MIFGAATSDRLGNITLHKISRLWLVVIVAYFLYLICLKDVWFWWNEVKCV